MKKLERFLAVILLSVFLLPATVSAETFGVEGVGDTDYPGMVSYHSTGTVNDQVFGMVFDDDENIYIAGTIATNTLDWLLQKYDANGVIDTDWGTDGTVTYVGAGFDGAHDLVIDGDNNIYVVGYIQTNGFDMAVRKYDATGALDTDWGDSGMVTYTSAGATTDTGDGIVIDGDGNIYVAAQVGINGGDITVFKYDNTGTLDATWGDMGSTTPYNSGGTQADFVNTIVLADDGSVFVGGSQATNGTDFVIIKYDATGQLDTTWGTGDTGIITYNSGGTQNDSVANLAIDTDGNIYASGRQGTNGNDWLIQRYDTDGDLDPAWGIGGSITYDSGSGQIDTVTDARLDASGNLYVVGYQSSNGTDWLILRYDTDGDIDTSWGTAGVVTYNSGGAQYDAANDILIDSEGRILIGGSHGSSGTTGRDVAIRRYTPDGTLDISFGNTPVGDFPSGYILASTGVLPEDGTIDSVSLYGATTIGTTTLAIYDEDFGLVWESDEIVSDVSGDWLTVPIASGTPATLDLTSDTYYLAFQLETTDAVPTYTGRAEAYDGFFSPQAYGAFPDPVVDPILSNINWSIYATYTPAPEPEVEEEEESSGGGGSSSSHRRSSSGSSNTTPNDAASPVAFVASGSVEELMIQLVALLQQLLEQLIAEQR